MRLFEVDEDAHVVLDEFRGEANGVLRRDRAVGPHFERKLLVVGHLPQARRFDSVIDLAHRRVDGIHRNVADGQVFIEVAVGGHVAAAVLDAHFQLQLAAFATRGPIDVLIEHGEVRFFFDHRGGHHARLIHVDVNRLGLIGRKLERHLLQVEDDIGGIFHHARDGRKLMQHAFDFYRGHRGPFDRTEQCAAQRIAHGGAPAALKRLRGKTPELIGQRLQLGCQTLRLLKTLPHHVIYSLLPCGAGGAGCRAPGKNQITETRTTSSTTRRSFAR